MSAKIFIAGLLQVSSLLLVALLVGCGGGSGKPAGPGFEAVAPILSEHCIACHQENGIAPFPLTSYTDARAKASPAAGVWRLPDGEAYYRDALRNFTTTNLTPKEVHQMGLDQARELGARAETILAKQGMTKGTGLLARALPTARTARGRAISRATHE